MKKRISDSSSMGMNSYGKEFQQKGLFLDLGILDLLKWRRAGIQFVTLLSEASLSEYPCCWNSPASSAVCTLPPWRGAGWHGGGTAPGHWHHLGLVLNLCSTTSQPGNLHTLWAAFASDLGQRGRQCSAPIDQVEGFNQVMFISHRAFAGAQERQCQEIPSPPGLCL